MDKPGAQLAAQRRTETKPCTVCGEQFTGLIKKTVCNKCKARLKTARYRAKLKGE
jgi:hypothetical protein